MLPSLRLPDVDAVGFDLDGTLLDHPTAATAAVHALTERFGVTATPGYVDLWFELESRHYERWLRGELSVHEQRRVRVLEFADALDSVVSDAEADEHFVEYFRAYRDAWRVYPDVLTALQAIRDSGRRIGVLTNGADAPQRDKLAVTGLDAFVDVVCTSDALGVAKPDSLAFDALATGLEVAPSRMVFVGDNFTADIAGARGAGIRAALVRSEGRTIAELASAVRRAAAMPVPARVEPHA